MTAGFRSGGGSPLVAGERPRTQRMGTRMFHVTVIGVAFPAWERGKRQLPGLDSNQQPFG